jgi:S1-C subfamily serine protease
MFANAYNEASVFTYPLIISMRFFDKTVECSLGCFVIINPEGWIVTAAHLLTPFLAFQQHSKEIAEYNKHVLAIEQDQRLWAWRKRKRIKRLKSNPKWITNHSFWWGSDGTKVQELKVLPEADLAVGRIESFDSKAVSTYPILKNTSSLPHGTSLCKLGFPFYQIKATFDEESKLFRLPSGTLPVPRFPIEGIYTRNLIKGKSKDGKYEIKFLETSSPGLKGQSGGPIFDVKGTLWGIQSRTTHYPLGFSPKIKKNGREIEENQFLNVGVGIHPEVLLAFLRDNGIKFEASNY